MRSKLSVFLVVAMAGLFAISQNTEEFNPQENASSTPPQHAPFVLDADIVLYDNGPLINSPGTGVGGADESVLQNTSLGLSTLGFGHQVANDNRVADNFTVPAGGWQVDQIIFYAYQTGSTTASTITAANLRIWDSPPGVPTRAVIWGDTTTNILAESSWSGIYRVTETTTGTASNRPIMANVVDVGVFLDAGQYWLDWQADGSLASGPWAPPITIPGLAITGDGLQSLDDGLSFNPANDGGTGAPQQGFPFIIIANELSSVPTFGYIGTAAFLTLIMIAGVFVLRRKK